MTPTNAPARLALFLLLLPLCLHAQTPSGAITDPPAAKQPQPNPDNTFTLRTTTRIVILDVVVLDRQNNIVRNLHRDDFHVTDDNQPETLLAFEPAGAHTPDPGTTINGTAQLDRLAPRAPVSIILLDEFNTRFEDMAFARYSLRKYLEHQPAKLAMPTMLIAVSLQNFTVLRDYTQDKDALVQALDQHLARYPWQVYTRAWLSERYGMAFGTLLRVATATEGHPGHKNMIWIGRGFPGLDFSTVPPDGRRRIESILQDTVNKLRVARVTLYTIDPAGVQGNPLDYGPDAAKVDPLGGNYQFSRLAHATGGRSLYGRNDVDGAIATSVQDGASFYTLTYRPTSELDRNTFRKIRVTFDNPDLHAVTREGYYPQRNPAPVDTLHPSQRLAIDLGDAAGSTLAYDGVPLTLQSDATSPGTFLIHVSAEGLTWSPATETEPRHTDIILLATSFDAKGRELQRIAKNVRAAAPATVVPTGPLDRSLDLKFTLPHHPNAVRARFTVRVTSTGKIGTADTPLNQLPPQSSSPPQPPRQ